MSQDALLICDVWDRHWCRTITPRVAALAERIDRFADAFRSGGGFVIHAPAQTMDFYRSAPQRALMQTTPVVSPPERRAVNEPGLVLPDRDSRCPDTPACVEPTGFPWPWSREHPAIHVAEQDGITEDGAEVYRAIVHFGVKTLYVVGVHTDVCVLNRPFGIRALRSWDLNCALVRDLTEASWPEDTDHVVSYIERYLCPVVASHDVIGSDI